MTMGDDFTAEARRNARATAAQFTGRIDVDQLTSFQADPTPRPCADCTDGECDPTCGRGID